MKPSRGRAPLKMTPLSSLCFLPLSLAALVLACADDAGSSSLHGSIGIDGSSTVFPITEAVAEEFSLENRRVRVTVGIAGTGGGFQRFCRGETAIQDASRPINQQESDACVSNGIEWIELPIAYDALTIVVSPRNDWASCLTRDELKGIWEPEAQGKITHWNQVRPEFPNAPLRLYGAGTDSGSFDYFTEVIVGKAKSSRGDYTASEDDNVLVQGVSGDRNSLAYFGLGYYEENKGKLKLVGVDSGSGCVLPTSENVESGRYAPLSRPLFIYVNTRDADRLEVAAFVDFYLQNVAFLANDVGYVGFSDELYRRVTRRWETRQHGSVYSSGDHSAPLEQLLAP
jgi:phosphate transport system substrate-binding protein